MKGNKGNRVMVARLSLCAVGVGLVGQVGAAVAGGIASLLAVRVVVAGMVRGLLLESRHLVVVSKRGIAARGDELLAVAVAVAVASAASTVLGLAAADGKDPEEVGAESKRGGDPDGGEETSLKGTLDAVDLGGGLDGADDGGRDARGETSGGKDDNGGDAGNKPGEAGGGAGAGGEDTDDQFKTKEYQAGDEGNLGDLHEGAEELDGLLDLLWQRHVDTSLSAKVLEVGIVEGLRSPVELRAGALALLVLGPAEAPQVDLEDVVEMQLSSRHVGTLGGLVEEAVDVDAEILADAVDVDAGVLGNAFEAVPVEADLGGVELEHEGIVVGDTGEGGVEEGDDGRAGHDQWQSHAGETTDTHGCGLEAGGLACACVCVVDYLRRRVEARGKQGAGEAGLM